MSYNTGMIIDSAFRGIGKGNTYFKIWRIEKFELVSFPRDNYGKFFTGDAYLIYSCTEKGQAGGPDVKDKPTRSGALERHIHFWLGAESTQDEAAVAAIKAVELDEYLGGVPIQHREVQGHESNRFRAYFKSGIRILQGGCGSGFNHITHDPTPKLYLVKGKRQPVIRQMSAIAWNVMNDGDAFVLDAGEYIFIWGGRQSNRLERLQAAKLAQTLKEENGGGTIVHVDDGAEDSMPQSEKVVFESFLPIAEKNQVKPASNFDSDEKEDIRTRKEIKLYMCTDEGGTLRVTEEKTGPLFQRDLKSEDTFIIDNGNCGIWVWVGRKATSKERTEAMRNAQGFIKKKGYNAHTPVTRVVESGEPSEFKSLFKGWKDTNESMDLKKKYVGGRGIAKVVQTKFDAQTLHDNRLLASESRMVDDGKGAKEIFRVERSNLLQVPEEEEGKFYSGDCYVILYAYNNGLRDNYLIYYWLGAHSSKDEQGIAALKTVELDDRLGGSPVQVRVVQGKEPPHFLAIFQGKLTIFQGGVASAFDGDRGRNVHVGNTYLLQIHGRTQLATKAMQVPLEASSLNTNDCFVLVSPQETYVWYGKGSTGDEKEMAKTLAHKTDRDPVVVYEGQEKPIFWQLLGGKGPYLDERILKDIDLEFNPRLFHGSNATGNFRMEEVLNFTQMDLVVEDVMLLDVGDCLFVWLGKHSNINERKMCIESAREYLGSDPSDRDKDIPIIVVKQGNEPPHFTGFFGHWDNAYFERDDSYDPIGSFSAQNGHDGMTNGSRATSGQNGKHFYSISVLRKNGDELPPDVEPLHKEVHLNDRDFFDTFGMSKEEFEELPNWKQLNKKKAAGLF